MRQATAAVQNYLANWGPATEASIADLYTFTLETGEVLRYSGWQIGLSAPAPGTTSPPSPSYFFALGPKFNHGGNKTAIGVEIAELEIQLYAGPLDEVGLPGPGAIAAPPTILWQEALWAGLFDGCLVALDHAIVDWTGGMATVIGTYNEFTGRVGDIDLGRSKTLIRVKSLLDLLSVQVPRRVWQASCTHIFGQPGVGMCGYDRVNGLNALGTATGIGAVAVTAGAGSTQNSIATGFTPGGSVPPTQYDQGTIIGTSGYNTGYTRTIGKLVGGVAYSLKPWIFPVVTGDGFQLLPGCDHTLPTCQYVLQNSGRYGGAPYIPPPETAI